MNINPGDVVQVIRPSDCCGDSSDIGNIFKVEAVFNGNGRLFCTVCGRSIPSAGPCADHPQGYTYQFHRLKKLPPVTEDEEIDEEIFA